MVLSVIARFARREGLDDLVELGEVGCFRLERARITVHLLQLERYLVQLQVRVRDLKNVQVSVSRPRQVQGKIEAYLVAKVIRAADEAFLVLEVRGDSLGESLLVRCLAFLSRSSGRCGTELILKVEEGGDDAERFGALERRTAGYETEYFSKVRFDCRGFSKLL